MTREIPAMLARLGSALRGRSGGGLQWGTEVVRDADAIGETRALACKPVDAKIITLESYDEYGYRYEYE
ncbi:hypothetical protein FUT88_17955 [Ralstonia sp. TCR112]|uniref:hypothetical protein n=1 Tax=Ralstonia sp. TCR112 TaxID=2601730 RepID=UPI0011BF6075|nr:hypothetical protein [Ralstonia sp. TCR112]TXD56862.1 hypothetical protein FUT88_17955 [Ralstonia sp. TCR112]